VRSRLASDTLFADNTSILSRRVPEATVIVRRRFVPALAFLLGALLLSNPARAQKPGPGTHDSIPGTYTVDQFKRALAGRGDLPDFPPELLDLLKNRMEKDGKPPLNEQQLNQAREMMQANPELRQRVEEMGRRLKEMKEKKNAIGPEERKQLENLFQPPPKNFPPPPVIDPARPMNLDPLPPPKNFEPPMPMPNPMFPPPDQRPDPLRKLDPNGKNPLDEPSSPRDKAAHAAASLWERNIGPLDETPAVKKALFELVEGTEDLKGPDGKSFWEELSLEEGQSTSLSELLDGASMAESWSLPKLELPDWNFGGGSGSGPDIGGGGSSGESWWSRNFGSSKPRPNTSTSGGGSSVGTPNISLPGIGQGGIWPVLILVGVLVAGLVVWKFWGTKFGRNRANGLLYGPGWPLDPRRITTREHVVIAFEYLSVLICGPSAKTWTHNTIADALADLAKTQGETAVMLARLYELARYAPLEEPLTTAELAEARRLVCALAGLEHE
jgi:hypothetical protein